MHVLTSYTTVQVPSPFPSAFVGWGYCTGVNLSDLWSRECREGVLQETKARRQSSLDWHYPFAFWSLSSHIARWGVSFSWNVVFCRAQLLTLAGALDRK
eukprot:522303-Amphidinium_carterae.2